MLNAECGMVNQSVDFQCSMLKVEVKGFKRVMI
jgi:hypothetical protein